MNICLHPKGLLKTDQYSADFLWVPLVATEYQLNMERWNNRVALVTGASAGVGAGLIQFLCKNGMRVVGCARRVERIEAMKQEQDLKTLFPYKVSCSHSNFTQHQ